MRTEHQVQKPWGRWCSDFNRRERFTSECTRVHSMESLAQTNSQFHMAYRRGVNFQMLGRFSCFMSRPADRLTLSPRDKPNEISELLYSVSESASLIVTLVKLITVELFCVARGRSNGSGAWRVGRLVTGLTGSNTTTTAFLLLLLSTFVSVRQSPPVAHNLERVVKAFSYQSSRQANFNFSSFSTSGFSNLSVGDSDGRIINWECSFRSGEFHYYEEKNLDRKNG